MNNAKRLGRERRGPFDNKGIYDLGGECWNIFENNNNTSTKDLRLSAVDPMRLLRCRCGPHLFCFNAKKKGQNEAEKRTEWSRKRNKVSGGLRRFIDGDSTLIASTVREVQGRMPEKPDAIRMATANSHTSLTDSQEPFVRSIGKAMVMTGNSVQHPIGGIVNQWSYGDCKRFWMTSL
jgi:hypothetical protein